MMNYKRRKRRKKLKFNVNQEERRKKKDKREEGKLLNDLVQWRIQVLCDEEGTKLILSYSSAIACISVFSYSLLNGFVDRIERSSVSRMSVTVSVMFL